VHPHFQTVQSLFYSVQSLFYRVQSQFYRMQPEFYLVHPYFQAVQLNVLGRHRSFHNPTFETRNSKLPHFALHHPSN